MAITMMTALARTLILLQLHSFGCIIVGNGAKTIIVGNGAKTVSESTVSNTELRLSEAQ